MSVVLSDAYRRGLDDSPGWLQKVHESVLEGLHRLGFVEKVSEKPLGAGLTVADFLVDYSNIDSIDTVRTLDPIVLRDRSQRGRFEGKVVLLGASDSAKDLFPVPGHGNKLYPGVLLHASAVNTLIKAPLYEFTHKGRLYIDLLFALVILVPIILIRLYYRNTSSDEVAHHRLQGLPTILVVLAAVVVGVMCVRLTRVMWDDFLPAITAIVFHPSIEGHLGNAWGWFRRHAPGAVARLVFTRKKENP